MDPVSNQYNKPYSNFDVELYALQRAQTRIQQSEFNATPVKPFEINTKDTKKSEKNKEKRKEEQDEKKQK